jgi:hypothetical protein
MSGNGKNLRQSWPIACRRDDTVRRKMTAIGLPDFENLAQCINRNRQMLRRLQNHEITPTKIVSRIQLDPLPADDDDLGFDGDWFASRRYRASLIPQAYDLLKDHSGPLCFVTIVHPKWERPVGQLVDANIDAATQWLGRRLQTLPCPVLVIGGYEASLRVELNGETYWAGHLHFVLAGAAEHELKAALKIEQRYRKRRYAKPVKVLPVGNLAKRLGYCTKRIVKRSVAYTGTNGRQQRRELPLTARHQIEFDSWLLGLPTGSRTVLFGCRLHHGQLRETKREV